MEEQTKAESYEQKMVALSRLFMGFLLGVGSLLSVWFLAGVSYVILR